MKQHANTRTKCSNGAPPIWPPKTFEANMRGSDNDGRLASLLRDPLIKLMMKSDGVTEQAVIALIDQVCRSQELFEGYLRTAGMSVTAD